MGGTGAWEREGGPWVEERSGGHRGRWSRVLQTECLNGWGILALMLEEEREKVDGLPTVIPVGTDCGQGWQVDFVLFQ